MMALSKEERHDLCSRIDLPALLEEDGCLLERSGSGFTTKLRQEERTASCHVAQRQSRWEYYDFGEPENRGDALSYLIDIRGLDFRQAVHWAIEKTGYRPPGWGTPRGKAAKKYQKTQITKESPVKPEPAKPFLAKSEQSKIVQTFLECLREIDPLTQVNGATYLRRRGILPHGEGAGQGWSIAYCLEREVIPELAERLRDRSNEMVRAGLMRKRKSHLVVHWWDDCILFVCRDRDGSPLSLVARMLNWEKDSDFGKYINQIGREGATLHPFGLQWIYRSREGNGFPAMESSALRILEGPADAIGSTKLGVPAIATLTRPYASGVDARSSITERFGAHIDALRAFQLIEVIPDNDDDPEKLAGGKRAADGLVRWLKGQGCNAERRTLEEIFPEEAPHCKDIADVAKLRVTQPPSIDRAA